VTVTAEALDRIELVLPEETVVLERRGTQWLLPDWQHHPAEAVFAESLVRLLTALPAGRPVAVDPAEVGLAPPARRIRLFGDGRPLAELWVGDPFESYGACHVSLPDGAVHIVAAPLLPALMRPTWGSRTVWRMNRSLIDGFRLGRFTWTEGEPDEDGLLELLAHLRAADVAFEPDRRTRADGRLTLATRHAELTLSLCFEADGTLVGWRDNPEIVYRFTGRFATLVRKHLAP